MLTLLLPIAFANDGPPPRLWAEVSGHSATLTVGLYEGGEPGVEGTFQLVQLDGAGQIAATVLEDHSFAADTPIGPTGVCRHPDGPDTGIDCATAPERCLDCDLDGVPECTDVTGYCAGGHLYEVVDPCVEPGEWTWQLRQDDEDYGADASGTVEDAGQDCTTAPTGSDDDDSGDPAASGGCGCDGQGAATGGLGLAMFAVGLLARKPKR